MVIKIIANLIGFIFGAFVYNTFGIIGTITLLSIIAVFGVAYYGVRFFKNKTKKDIYLGEPISAGETKIINGQRFINNTNRTLYIINF